MIFSNFAWGSIPSHGDQDGFYFSNELRDFGSLIIGKIDEILVARDTLFRS